MDTYAPVVGMTTVRFVFAVAVMLTLHVSGIDFTNAFLNAPLNDEIHVNAHRVVLHFLMGMCTSLNMLYSAKAVAP